MYKTIVCAVEIGNEGRELLTKASTLADKFGSRLIVVNVLPYTFLPKDYQKELTEKAIPEFEKLVAEFKVAKKNRVLKVGKPHEIICQVAKRKKADLILLGTHSKKGLQSLIGSTASAVSNNAVCDVSLVRMK
ncbi:universal stress protein [Planctobacterium marinum]|uniref:universal stress protein n=1 Tax=Planctobacterium marinum TaxID=1631968 RepID=UPI001E34B673|nr:universal stress protein [Planctobacterium marinum]MCC2603859.1 universal stress protein [Planctobacterium marinum]